MREADPVIELIRKELNRSLHLFERDQQEEGLEQDKENDEKKGRFKRMSKSSLNRRTAHRSIKSPGSRARKEMISNLVKKNDRHWPGDH